MTELSDDQATEIKARQRRIWAAGNWDEFSKTIEGVGANLLDHAGLDAGMEVLDVGTGTGGTLAIPAAQRGARVVGSDLTPEHFDAARLRAKEAGVEIEWVEADAEDLPFDDARFDRVFSTFGHMFAPRHEAAASEMARVCRPGGTVAFTTWPADSKVAEMFITIAKHMPPPPPGFVPPVMWGVEEHVGKMLEPLGLTPEISRGQAVIARPSTDAVIQMWEENFGPVVVARAVLGDGYPALRADLVDFFERSNEADDGSFRVTFEYMITVAPKPA
ncbi:virulence-associated methyltransferase [soil metagenome]